MEKQQEGNNKELVSQQNPLIVVPLFPKFVSGTFEVELVEYLFVTKKMYEQTTLFLQFLDFSKKMN